MAAERDNELKIIHSCISDLNWIALRQLQERTISELTDTDLHALGFCRMNQLEGQVYSCKDIYGFNRYYIREHNRMHYHCCNQGCVKYIESTKCLIVDAIFNWKLKCFGLDLNLQTVHPGKDTIEPML